MRQKSGALLSVMDVCVLLGVADRKARDIMLSLTHVRVGKLLNVRPDVLERWQLRGGEQYGTRRKHGTWQLCGWRNSALCTTRRSAFAARRLELRPPAHPGEEATAGLSGLVAPHDALSSNAEPRVRGC